MSFTPALGDMVHFVPSVATTWRADTPAITELPAVITYVHPGIDRISLHVFHRPWCYAPHFEDVINVAYSKDRLPGTWHYKGDHE